MSDHADPIEVLLDDLLARLRAFDRLDQHWLVTTLLDELGFAHGVGATHDHIENVRDVGEGFVTTVALAAQRHPERTGDVYRAAHDPGRQPHDPGRQPHDPGRLPHDPGRLLQVPQDLLDLLHRRP